MGHPVYQCFDGKIHSFNKELARSEMIKRVDDGMAKSTWYKNIAKKAHCTEKAVLGWFEKEHYPSDLKMVEAIEDTFEMKRGTLLIPTYDEEKREPANTINIFKESGQMFAAINNLFGELCEMIFFATQSLGRMDVPADLEYPEIDDCYDDRIPFDCKYKNQEQYRSKCIFDVRKSALFLSPKSIQECLILIDDAFGDRDVEYNDGIFNSDRYRNWLTREGTRDNIDSRICFSRNFREELYNRLLTIFKEYTSIHEMT